MAAPEPRPLSISVPGVLGTLLVLATAAVCVRLGFWQLQRLAERRERTAEVVARWEAEPVVLSEPPTDTIGWTYRRVRLRGTYDADRTIVYPSRSLRGVPGAHVLTPLRLEGSGGWVLVNRGYMPAADGAHPNLAQAEPPPLEDALGFVLAFPGGRTPPAPEGSVSPPDGEFRRIWYSIDPAAIRAQFPYALGGVAVQLLPGTDVPDYPIRLPPPSFDDGPHLGYAIQWFSFAAIAIIGWAVMVAKSGTRAKNVAASAIERHP